MRTRCQLSGSATLILVGAALAGCSEAPDDGPARYPVTGTITFQNRPLDQGVIQFAPSGAGTKHGGGAPITEGEYSIPADQGLPTGTYKVMIFSADESGPVPHEAPGDSSQVAREKIPPQYNVQSDKTVEIKTDGENTFDFDIK